MFSKFPLIMAFFLCFLHHITMAQSTAWMGYVTYFDAQNVYRREANIPVCQYAKNGTLRIEPTATTRSLYWTNFEFNAPICLTDNFTYEIKFKNNQALNGFPAYDAAIDLKTPSGTTGCTLMGDIGAKQYTSLTVAGQVLTSNQAFLCLDYSNWATVKLKFQNKTVAFYYNDKLFFSAPYTGNICNLQGFTFRFKGSAAVDLVKIVNDDDNTVVYNEDFTSCAAMAKPVDCNPTVTINATRPCEGDSLKLTTTTIASTYEWSGPNGFKSALQNPSIPKATLNYSGTYTLQTQLNACQKITKTVDAIVNPAPIVDLGTDTSYCNGQTLSLDAKNDGSTYLWNMGTKSRFQSVKSSGVYAVTVTNTEGCHGADTVKIEIAPTPILPGITSKKPSCYGKCDGEVAANARGGFGAPFSYQWSGGRTSSNVISRCAGDITLTVTDSKGCKIQTVASVGQPAKIDAVAWGDTIYNGYAVRCANSQDGQASVKPSGGSGGYSMVWQTSPLQVGYTAKGLKPDTIYKVFVYDKNGCSDSTTVSLKAPPSLKGSFSFKEVRCVGDKNGEIILKGVSGGVAPYSFMYNEKKFPYDGASSFNNLASGKYSFALLDANSCSITDTVNLKDPPKLKIISTEDTLIHFGDDLRLFAGVAPPSVLGSLKWTSSNDSLIMSCKECRVAQVSPRKPTFFNLVVKDTFGCEVSKQILVRVDKQRKVFVPTAFSPNEDGQNDVFMPFSGNGTKRILSFTVFNRWGAMLHQERDFLPNDDSKSWDGKFNGNNLPSDIYIWFTEIEFEDGEREVFKGDVNLLR